MGPAFDSKVKGRLGLGAMTNPEDWVRALKLVSRDIHAFEQRNAISFEDATPEKFRMLNNGRIYDMALGPR